MYIQNYKNEPYLVGFGDDITIQSKLKDLFNIAEKGKEKALEELQRKEKELAAIALQLSENSDVITFVNKKNYNDFKR